MALPLSVNAPAPAANVIPGAATEVSRSLTVDRLAVPAKMSESPVEAGATLPDQFSIVDQLPSAPPPSQVKTAAWAEGTRGSAEARVTSDKRRHEADVFGVYADFMEGELGRLGKRTEDMLQL